MMLLKDLLTFGKNVYFGQIWPRTQCYLRASLERVNLSSFQLTPAMISLLSKGLNFCPTPGEPDRYLLRKDLDKFHVSLRGSLFFDKESDAVLDLSTPPTALDTLSNDEGDPFDNF